MSAAETMAQLEGLGIHLRRYRAGEHRVACPGCGKGPKDDALGVRLEPEGGAIFSCFRCGWAGRVSADEQRSSVAPRPTPPPRLIEPLRPAQDPWPTWEAGQPIIGVAPAARYLEGRACALPPPDGHVRWLPAACHPCGHVGPALVALVTDAATGERMTLHRTWLARDGSGKAAIDRPRLLWPGLPKAGGVVRLLADDEISTGLAIAEGIETALSALAVGYPVWACIDAGNLAGFPVLEGIEALTILADRDRPDRHGRRAGQEAAEACAARWRAAGREVRVWLPLAEGEDFNDVAQRMAA